MWSAARPDDEGRDDASWFVVWAAAQSVRPALRTALADELATRGAELLVIADAELAPRGQVVGAVGVGDAIMALTAADASRGAASVVLVDCRMTEDTLELVDESSDVAILSVVDVERRDLVVDAVDAFLSSSHEESDLVVGATEASATAAQVASWFDRRRGDSVAVSEVAITTIDGWVLGADLYQCRSADSPRPAVVLMHSGRSDRIVYSRLGRLLARRGIVALALDWRGRGTSTNRGRFAQFSAEEQAAVRDDVVAAYDFLGALPGVDGGRFGLVGVAHGAAFGADGALGDPRTRALVLMTAHLQPDDHQRSVLGSGAVSVMYVTGRPHRTTTEAMRAAYEVTAGRHTRLVVYPEGVLGYQLFDLHEELEPMIADWFVEALSP